MLRDTLDEQPGEEAGPYDRVVDHPSLRDRHELLRHCEPVSRLHHRFRVLVEDRFERFLDVDQVRLHRYAFVVDTLRASDGHTATA